MHFSIRHSTSYTHRHWLSFCRLLCLGVGLLLLSSCRVLPQSEQEVAVEVVSNSQLPGGWELVGDLYPVSLDSDTDNENLAFFSFDSGQIGAFIIEGDPATSISPPDFLLPRYFDDLNALGQGIIAAPRTPANLIRVEQVSGSSPTRELVIVADETHLTIAWWKGAGLGYGVTQLFAAGGFNMDWDGWQREPRPITSIMGYTPLTDYRARSNICRVVQYTRRTDLPSNIPAVIFHAQPQGLHFCGSVIPTHPFSPEGVVLAYLLGARVGDGALSNLLTPETTLAQVDAESAYERLRIEHIVDVATYPSVPMSQAQVSTIQEQGGAASPTTTVCVEFSEIANATLRRWVVYTLRFQPADSTQRLPDRWTVSGARSEPIPMQTFPAEASPTGYCEIVLQRNAPR